MCNNLSQHLPSRIGLQNTPTSSLQRGKNPRNNECPVYDSKQSDGEVSVMLELWRMQIAPSLPSLPSPLWPGVIAPETAQAMGQIKQKYILLQN